MRLLLHKFWVAAYLFGFCCRLLWRALVHDLRKIQPHQFEAHEEGVKGMTLIDLLEWYCNCRAAPPGGNLITAIVKAWQQHGLSDDVVCILENQAAHRGVARVNRKKKGG